mmetsp:Transcript_1371/g.1541  ORF Transcript_1371/g.1541 Transcript_1371/m.1541 type:complete len:111 (+) Transcript_1371:62-394(+)|eukprot:CAMPEP_0168333002 /NCGR_PEP_ID=MMETSP0213-20121227/9321_1 /TAXON_ID=151035 /ORGANISM="Euplotes harpa, Strain FSP1.4" /LENGTH=110 /DNA_ID=CAMNT_0008337189 /DNA_START=38 /DNA_END=370 /DNA_ORIENTATION=-
MFTANSKFDSIFYAFPWVQNSVVLDLNDPEGSFDLKKIKVALDAKIRLMECAKEGCKHNSDGVRVDTRETRCDCHIPLATESSEFTPVSKIWADHESKLQSIYEKLLRIQ